MEGLENLNDELKNYIVINNYKLPNIEYPYYKFYVYYPIEQYIDEINNLFLRQKKYIDLLREYDNNINFEVEEDYHGIISIKHSNFIKIEDIENKTLDEIENIFETHKKQIDWFKLLHDDLKKFIISDNIDDISISHKRFELKNVLDYNPIEINSLFLKQIEKQNELLDRREYEKYLLTIPSHNRLKVFKENSELPKKGTLHYDKLNGRDKWGLTDKEYWGLLRFLWLENSEKIKSSSYERYSLFTCKRDNKEFFMNEEEREYFNKLPNEFVVYRGIVKQKSTKEQLRLESDIKWNLIGINSRDIGFSYTLSKDVGYKYFEKYKKYNKENIIENYIIQSDLREIVVKKEEVFGFINEKNEQEILIFKLGKYVNVPF